MTDKQAFIDKLSAALKLRGVSEVDAATYIERFEKYWDRMAEENGETSRRLSDTELVADAIAAQVSERTSEIDLLAERTMTVDAVAPTEEITISSDEDGLYDDCDSLYSDEAECLIPLEEMSVTVNDGADEQMLDEGRLPEYKPQENIPASSTFKLLAAASLPITIPLAVVFFASFGVLWLAIIALMVAAVGAVVMFAAGGAAVSLVGIVFGVIQLFSDSVAVGVYEIGLGVTVIGVVMLVCILLYNLAVRLMPFLMKLVFKLFKYTILKLKELYRHLKKESAKL